MGFGSHVSCGLYGRISGLHWSLDTQCTHRGGYLGYFMHGCKIYDHVKSKGDYCASLTNHLKRSDVSRPLGPLKTPSLRGKRGHNEGEAAPWVVS